MAFDELGERVAEEKVVPDFRLTEGWRGAGSRGISSSPARGGCAGDAVRKLSQNRVSAALCG
jgi:hypothetical protein